MMQIRIGVQLTSLKQPFKKALHTAARLGASAVEIDARNEVRPSDLTRTGVRAIRKMLEDVNLRVCAVSFQTRRGYDVLDQLDRRIEATKQAMDMAYQLGANLVVNQVGRVDFERGDELDLLKASLMDLGRYSQKAGAFLAARTGSEAPEVLRELMDQLPEGSLQVALDPGGLIVNGFSAREAARVLGPEVAYVYAKDGVRDLAQGRGIEVELGRGSIDLPELAGILEQNEYRGYFTVERRHAAEPILEVANAVEYLKNL